MTDEVEALIAKLKQALMERKMRPVNRKYQEATRKVEEEVEKTVEGIRAELVEGNSITMDDGEVGTKSQRPAAEKKRPKQSGSMGMSEAVRQVLRSSGHAMDNAEITEALKPLNLKLPATKSLARAVAGAVYNLKKTGHVIQDSETGKYRIGKK